MRTSTFVFEQRRYLRTPTCYLCRPFGFPTFQRHYNSTFIGTNYEDSKLQYNRFFSVVVGLSASLCDILLLEWGHFPPHVSRSAPSRDRFVVTRVQVGY